MNIKTLADLSQEILYARPFSFERRPGQRDIDVRTIRYYDAQKILDEPQRVGRENVYSAKHLKRILAIKILQGRGRTLLDLSRTMQSTGVDDNDVLRTFGVNPDAIEILATKYENTQIEQATNQTEEHAMPKAEVKNANISEEEAMMEMNPDYLTVTITDGDKYKAIQGHAKIGSAFVFVKDLPDADARKLFKLINGQKAGSGKITDGVFFADEHGLDMPGCTVASKPVASRLAIACPDKDSYKEAVDTARVFIYDPNNAGKEVTVKVMLSGAHLDSMKLPLDENGCVIAMVPTLVSGQYYVLVEESGAECRFSASRYEVAPLTVVTTATTKIGDALTIDLRAESFGNPFSGKARIDVMDEGAMKASYNVVFENGTGSVQVLTHGMEGSIALRVISVDDPKLVASTPVRGAKREERTDTAVALMGKVHSMSLLPSAGSKQARGLSFATGQVIVNSPVRMASCIGNSISLEFVEDMNHVVVALRDPFKDEYQVVDLGNIKQKKTKKLSLPYPVTFVQVGGFVGGKEWEAHAFAVMPAAEGSLSVAKKVEPGDKLRITIHPPKAHGKTSVLLKVLDKRVRPQYEPMTSIASLLKRWTDAFLPKRMTGSGIASLMPLYVPGLQGVSGYNNARGMVLLRAAPWATEDQFGAVYHHGGGGGQSSSPVFGTPTFHSLSTMGLRREIDESADSLRFFAQAENHVALNNVEEKTSGRPILASNSSAGEANYFLSSPVQKKNAQVRQEAREEISDVIYCDLLKVSGKKEVIIDLPAVIGDFEVRAFFANGTDWSEAVSSVRVEKAIWIEPMIPQVVHPDDGVKCTAVIAGITERAMFSIRVNGQPVKHDISRNGLTLLTWDALPGIHEVSVVSPAGNDRIRRVVDVPGEEIVMTQEMRVLAKGEKYDLVTDDALSVSVMPGIEAELKTAIAVVTNFEHLCCEQTSAKVVAAAMAVMIGDDQTRAEAFKALVNGEKRLAQYWRRGEGFTYYPQGIIYDWASATAALRVKRIAAALQKTELPAAVAKAVKSMGSMADNVVQAHGNKVQVESKHEKEYHEGKTPTITKQDVDAAGLTLAGFWINGAADVAYAAAGLIRAKKLDIGLKLANSVAKEMGPSMGNGMHGTVEVLAYLFLVIELKKAGVVGGSGGKVSVNGKQTSIEKATKATDITEVEAIDGGVALRVNRLSRIRFEDHKSALSFSVAMTSEKAGQAGGMQSAQAGRPVSLRVTLGEKYKDGDVLCVALPDCVSRVIGGVKEKKFQLDFAGKKEVDVDLVAHGATEQPQRWHAVVRNMYDPARIGSMGILTMSVKS